MTVEQRTLVNALVFGSLYFVGDWASMGQEDMYLEVVEALVLSEWGGRIEEGVKIAEELGMFPRNEVLIDNDQNAK